MTDQEQTYLEMLIGTYITGRMMQNYIQSVILERSKTPKAEKYLHNKLDKAFQATAKLLSPLDKYLISTGGFDALEEGIMGYHEVIDEVLSLDERGLLRVKNLIKKIKEP